MATLSAALAPRSEGPAFTWRRLRFTLLAGLPFGLLLSVNSQTPTWAWVVRSETVALAALGAYALLERHPQRLSPRVARWVLQLAGVMLSVPLAAFLAYAATTGTWAWWGEPRRLGGYAGLCFAGMLFGPWIALAAMVRAREALAERQALGFQLERSELERRALDARLRLMQAQVAPHFLFNTLANIRALVAAGSPQAPALLESLIAYLRAAVPRLDDADATFEAELELVRAYLDLMQMRMPDRLQFSVHADPAALPLRCPPMTLLTLVENAVRHGVDPAEDGGRIDVSVTKVGERCLARVIDTGVGLGAGTAGTGLATLRERLQLAFGGDAQLRLTPGVPRGACSEVEFPARESGA